jgi:hypothetical protein
MPLQQHIESKPPTKRKRLVWFGKGMKPGGVMFASLEPILMTQLITRW